MLCFIVIIRLHSSVTKSCKQKQYAADETDTSYAPKSCAHVDVVNMLLFHLMYIILIRNNIQVMCLCVRLNSKK